MPTIPRTGYRFAPGITGPRYTTSKTEITTEHDNGDAGSSVTIYWDNGNNQKITLTASCQISFVPPESGIGTFVLRIIQANEGGHTITWPEYIKWSFGQEPSLATILDAESIVSLKYYGESYGWYGQAIAWFALAS